MKEQFVTYEIVLKLEELGFDEECFAYYNTIRTAIDENESIYKKSKVLFLEYDNQFNQIFPIWFEKDIVEEVWKEGSYWNGEHSRCELVGNNIKAPLWQQVIDWFREKHDVHIIFSVNPYSTDINQVYGYKIYTDDNLSGLNCVINYECLMLHFIEAIERSILTAIELCKQ